MKEPLVFITETDMAIRNQIDWSVGFYERKMTSKPQHLLSKFCNFGTIPDEEVSSTIELNCKVGITPEVNGIIFNKTRSISGKILKNLEYWNRSEKLDSECDRAIIYHQNPLASYFVELDEESDDCWLTKEDSDLKLLTEGFVVDISYRPKDVVIERDKLYCIRFSASYELFDSEDGENNNYPSDPESIRSKKLVYSDPQENNLMIFIKGSELEFNSVSLYNSNHIYIDLLNYNGIDYGYYY